MSGGILEADRGLEWHRAVAPGGEVGEITSQGLALSRLKHGFELRCDGPAATRFTPPGPRRRFGRRSSPSNPWQNPRGFEPAIRLLREGRLACAIREGVAGHGLSLAKTSFDSLRSTEIRQSVHRPKTPSLVGGGATGIVRPSTVHGHTGVAREDGERAGWAAELDLGRVFDGSEGRRDWTTPPGGR